MSPLGTKKLSTRVEGKESSQTIGVNFLMVDIHMAYNVILGQPNLSAIKAVVPSCLLLM